MSLSETIKTEPGRKIFLQLFKKFQTLDFTSEECGYKVNRIKNKIWKKTVIITDEDRRILSKTYSHTGSTVNRYFRRWKNRYLDKISGTKIYDKFKKSIRCKKRGTRLYRANLKPFFDYLKSSGCKLNYREIRLIELFFEHGGIRGLAIKNSNPHFIDGCKWVIENIFVKNWINTDSIFYISEKKNEDQFIELFLIALTSDKTVKITDKINKYLNTNFKDKDMEIKSRKEIFKGFYNLWKSFDHIFKNFNDLLAFYFWKVLNQRELLCKLSSFTINQANKENIISRLDEIKISMEENIIDSYRKMGSLRVLRAILRYKEFLSNGEILKSKDREIQNLLESFI
ncbi:MAG: hypothetical protein COS47_01370 [Candidatus Nealsonbacteria bacterium CG03_land_8_20_14_0_80_36_12]|uniref:Uncharacterized protein n=1 Tax=Candidatus Nealsonbacteria bacterium CG03_land_8_20_14_0_80_36_12 TaxID=1974701 RepID=A0A2M7BY96_9BACT|nr:MAG: hypothetical protein COS47_01370 [Candidatus Nealsonbacteria bacterium CG03_land_8_20_14_0_80_36_12]